MDLVIGTYDRIQDVKKYGPPSKEEVRGEIIGGWLGGAAGVGLGLLVGVVTGPIGIACIAPTIATAAVDVGRGIGKSKAK